MKKLCVFIAVVCLSAPAFAETKPSPADAQKVIDYYYNGAGQGALLMDYALCREVDQEGEQKNECTSKVTDGKVYKGEKTFLWMKMLVPSGDRADLLIQFTRNNKIRKVINTTATGSIRFRTWKVIPTDKTGTWSVSILQETESNDLHLGSLEYTVVDPELVGDSEELAGVQ